MTKKNKPSLLACPSGNNIFYSHQWSCHNSTNHHSNVCLSAVVGGVLCKSDKPSIIIIIIIAMTKKMQYRIQFTRGPRAPPGVLLYYKPPTGCRDSPVAHFL